MLEKQVTSLQNQVTQLKSTSEIEKNANTIKSDVPHFQGSIGTAGQEDVESYVAQIEFLNSVIVDIQRKNEALQTKVDSLISNGYTDEVTELSNRCVIVLHISLSLNFCSAILITLLTSVDGCFRFEL